MATCATYFYWLNQSSLLNSAQVTVLTINDVVGGLVLVQQALSFVIFVVLFVIWCLCQVWGRTKKQEPQESSATHFFDYYFGIDKGTVKALLVYILCSPLFMILVVCMGFWVMKHFM